MGYAAGSLARVAVFNDTPNGSQGGIWQSGGGLSADSSGNIFLQTGNGTFDANMTGGVDYGDSFLKLSTAGGLSVTDYFTPDNQNVLRTKDLDLGSGAGLVLPKQSGSFPDEIISAGKEGIIYVVNRDDMGRFNSSSNNVIETVTGSVRGYYSSPAYFNHAVYYSGAGDFLDRYSLTEGLLSTTPVSQSATTYNVGSTPSISANGLTNAIVWAIDRAATPGATAVLHAYDAGDVSNELYNSSQNATRDRLGAGTQFSVPTVAGGRAYIGTTKNLVAYGLL